jgi:DNA modification methylase
MNIGDSWANDTKWGGSTGGKHAAMLHGDDAIGRRRKHTGLKSKDLMMIPHRLAIAMQEDGWRVRMDVVWAKPNPMPESVEDRPTKAHEYLFLMSKSERYNYDASAIMEPVTGNSHARGDGVNPKAKQMGPNSRMFRDQDPAHQKASDIRHKQNRSFSAAVHGLVDKRNKRSVWTIPTQAYSGAHFATFPEDLVTPCILAGCPTGGTVLDPFAGSGTTGLVAKRNGCKAILIELNPEYAKLAAKRLRQQVLGFAAIPEGNAARGEPTSRESTTVSRDKEIAVGGS